jgi:hypothetical protein
VRQLTDVEKRTVDALFAGSTIKALAAQEGVRYQTIDGRVKRVAHALGINVSGVGTLQAVMVRWAEMQPRKKIRLPDTRDSVTHKATIYSEHGDADVFITAGRYENGRIGEVFVNIGLQGSTLRGTLDAWARMVSISLQWGVPLEDIIEKFKSVAFEPAGPTNNPNIPKCNSIVDYTVRWLEQEVNHARKV